MFKSNNTIPKGWTETTLGEVAEKMYSGGTPSTQRGEFYGGNIPWLRTQEVNFNYIYDTDIKITNEGLNNSSARWIPKNTVIVAMYGNSAGRVAFSKIKTTTNQACCNFIANPEKADPFYIYFNLKGRYSEIEGMANGGAQQNLSVGVLKNLEILLPPLPEQRAIAAVLSSLDDKIELLREQNKTLEATAQAIFKEWFVNFNFPGATGKMIDSELGKIPEGCKISRLGEIVNLTIGRTPPRKESEWFSTNPEDIKWLSIRDLGNAGTFVFGTSEYLTNEAIEKHKIQIVPKGTVLISFKLTVGRVAITMEEMATNEAIAHLKLPEESRLTAEYLYLYFKSFDFNLIGSTSSIATAFNSESLRSLDILVPENNVLDIFAESIKPIFKKLSNNTLQIQSLSTLRDMLLLKLIRGEIRVNF